MDAITPIFLLSLPRAGSTLVQRLIAADENIATASEPWLLLPLVCSHERYGTFAEYSHWLSLVGREDFAKALPGGEQTYRSEMASYVQRLYRLAAGDGPAFFLDKTPRYALIIQQLLDMFPDGRFVFLWRNPLAIAASMMETFTKGKWNLDFYYIDLYDGQAKLIEAAKANAARVCCVQYETLLADPHAELGRVFSYLELPYDATLTARFADVQLDGRWGDKWGAAKYGTLSDEPLHKWKALMGNPLRRRWCRSYLRWLGRERLAFMGYDLDGLLDEVHALPRTLKFVGSDIVRRTGGWLERRFERSLFAHKRATRRRGRATVSHT